MSIPLIATLRTYTRDALRGDLNAGLTTAVMLVPQAMAYALLAGLPPIVGLYAAIVPLVVYGVLGTSPQLAVGPVAMVSLLVASGVGSIAEPGSATYVAAAVALAAMVGAIQLAMGFARLGAVVDLLSHPVIAGFTSAAALIIGFSQLQHILGVRLDRSHQIWDTVGQAIHRVGDWHAPTLILGLASVAALALLQRAAPRWPRHLLVVVAATAAVSAFGLDGAGVAVIGEVPAGLPAPAVPRVDLDTVRALLPMAGTIALVGFMESIAVARAFARQHGHRLDTDQELKALGAANLAGAAFGAYPVTGGFSRTAVNAQAGARTGVAGLVTAAAVALALLFLTPWLVHLPKAVLAAIIATAVAGLVDVREARRLWRVSKPDLAQMLLTFSATLALGIEQGIVVGVLASLAWFVRTASRPHVALLGRLPGTARYKKLDRNPQAVSVPGVLVARIDAPLFFANVAFLDKTLRELEGAQPTPVQAVVLDATGIGHIDASGCDALDGLRVDYRDRGIELWVAGARGPVQDALARAHFWERLGHDRCVEQVHDAVVASRGQVRAA